MPAGCLGLTHHLCHFYSHSSSLNRWLKIFPAPLLSAPNAASAQMLSSFYIGSDVGAASFLLSNLQIEGRGGWFPSCISQLHNLPSETSSPNPASLGQFMWLISSNLRSLLCKMRIIMIIPNSKCGLGQRKTTTAEFLAQRWLTVYLQWMLPL